VTYNPNFKVAIIQRQITSKLVQNRATITMADQLKVVYDLPNGASFSDLERRYPRFQAHAIR